MESRITPLLTLSALKASNANDQTLESKPESQQTTQQQLIGYPSLTDSFTKGSRKPGTSSTRLGETMPLSNLSDTVLPPTICRTPKMLGSK